MIEKLRHWRKKVWREELRVLLREILSSREMRLIEILAILHASGIYIHGHALSQIIVNTAGIYIIGQTYSQVSKKMVNIYTAGVRS